MTGLTDAFEAQRPHLRAVAYRMLGSFADADDAVQEAWLRFNRTDTSEVENLPGWLTTVVSRIALDMLRARSRRGEEALEDARIPDMVVEDPAAQTELADAVGIALLVVLETLPPAERLAFVLHDTFAVPFDEIARILDKSPEAARQLASRARRKVRGTAPSPDGDYAAQRRVVDAFLAAARDGDFEGLLAALHPDVVLRADVGESGIPAASMLRGAEQVAGQAMRFRQAGVNSRPVLVNGGPGQVSVRPDGTLFSLLAFTVVDGRIVAMDVLADPERLAQITLP